MRLRHPREWREAYASWQAGARTLTRAEARWFCVTWGGISVGLGGAYWWEPLGTIAVLAAFVVVYVLWRARNPLTMFRHGWERDVAERTGWPPRLVVGTVYAAFGFYVVSMVLSWLR